MQNLTTKKRSPESKYASAARKLTNLEKKGSKLAAETSQECVLGNDQMQKLSPKENH